MKVVNQVTFPCAFRLHVEIPEFDPGYGRNFFFFFFFFFTSTYSPSLAAKGNFRPVLKKPTHEAWHLFLSPDGI
jgi:hypothetical protein